MWISSHWCHLCSAFSSNVCYCGTHTSMKRLCHYPNPLYQCVQLAFSSYITVLRRKGGGFLSGRGVFKCSYFILCHEQFSLNLTMLIDYFTFLLPFSPPLRSYPTLNSCWCLLLSVSVVVQVAHLAVWEHQQPVAYKHRRDPEERVSHLTTMCASGVYN